MYLNVSCQQQIFSELPSHGQSTITMTITCKDCFVSYTCGETNRFLSYSLAKKIPLSQRIGYVMDRSMDKWVCEWVRDVCMSHQSDWIHYKPIKFLVFVGDTCNTILYLLVSNGNLTLCFYGQVVAIKKLTLVHTVRIYWQTRSQSSGKSRKMFGPILS